MYINLLFTEFFTYIKAESSKIRLSGLLYTSIKTFYKVTTKSQNITNLVNYFHLKNSIFIVPIVPLIHLHQYLGSVSFYWLVITHLPIPPLPIISSFLFQFRWSHEHISVSNFQVYTVSTRFPIICKSLSLNSGSPVKVPAVPLVIQTENVRALWLVLGPETLYIQFYRFLSYSSILSNLSCKSGLCPWSRGN